MTQNQAIESGTIVKLKSGGPEMTVEKLVKDFTSGKPTGDVDCQWFAGKKLEKGRFPIGSLEVITP